MMVVTFNSAPLGFEWTRGNLRVAKKQSQENSFEFSCRKASIPVNGLAVQYVYGRSADVGALSDVILRLHPSPRVTFFGCKGVFSLFGRSSTTTTMTTTTTTSTRTTTALLVWLCWSFFLLRESHAFASSGRHSPIRNPFGVMKQQCKTRRPVSLIIIDAGNSTDEAEFEEEDEDDEPEPEDPYLQVAASEFQDKAAAAAKKAPPGISSLMTTSSAASSTPRTTIDWGGALGKLRQRMEDVETGKSQNPSQVLFRLMSSQTPNQAIGSFVSSANPDVVQAMSGAVSALLGGLSNPAMGIETIVKASGEKIGSLCFQLQMTGAT